MKKNKLLLLPILAVALITSISCTKEKEDPIIPNEGELITTVIYTLIDTVSLDTAIFTFRDIDGDGGIAPIIHNDTINANSSYLGSLQLLNESVSPSINITSEILNEGEEHQFFYGIQSLLNAQVEYRDSDALGNPIGLKTTFISGETCIGVLRVILRHEPDKYGEGVSDGDITNAGGETDIEVDFEISIQ